MYLFILLLLLLLLVLWGTADNLYDKHYNTMKMATFSMPTENQLKIGTLHYVIFLVLAQKS